MRRRVRNALLVIATLTAAAGAGEFPYYPEYADVFSQYDEITPLMAKKQVINEPMVGFDPGNVVCEPLVIRDVNDMPFCYMIATYRGEDLEVARRWNALVTAVNEGEDINAAKLAEEIYYFETPEIVASFGRQTIPVFTFGGPMHRASDKGIPFAFTYYDEAYAKAKLTLGDAEIYLVRIIGRSYDYYQAFEFRSVGGGNVIITVNHGNEEVEVADEEVIARQALECVEWWADGVTINREQAEENHRFWLKLDAEVPDEKVVKEFPVIRDWASDPIKPPE